MKRTKQKQILVILAVVMLAAGGLAAWFAAKPGLDRRKDRERQTELLDSIRSGDGRIVLPENRITGDVDFYDGGAEAPGEEAAVFLPLLEPPVSGGSTGIVSGIGILSIDRIDLELPVAEGVSGEQLKVAVGHVPQTPQVGDSGNAVIAGHRSYTFGEHFNRLGELEAGDPIRYRSIHGEEMTFVVDEILEIAPGDPAAFEQPEDQRMLTLYTCTPIRTATHRLLVRALRVDE